MAQSMEHALKKDTHIGVYEIKEVIRIDDFGITYRAWNEHLNSRVAMTCLLYTSDAADDASSV